MPGDKRYFKLLSLLMHFNLYTSSPTFFLFFLFFFFFFCWNDFLFCVMSLTLIWSYTSKLKNIIKDLRIFSSPFCRVFQENLGFHFLGYIFGRTWKNSHIPESLITAHVSHQSSQSTIALNMWINSYLLCLAWHSSPHFGSLQKVIF